MSETILDRKVMEALGFAYCGDGSGGGKLRHTWRNGKLNTTVTDGTPLEAVVKTVVDAEVRKALRENQEATRDAFLSVLGLRIETDYDSEGYATGRSYVIPD